MILENESRDKNFKNLTPKMILSKLKSENDFTKSKSKNEIRKMKLEK